MSKVTVVVAIYNHAEYLKKCLQSILMQKTSFAFKALLVDDASTDGSSDIVRQYAEQHPDIFIPVIREKNLGVVDSIYNALITIDTPYFAALEGDDYWTDESKLQRQADALDAHPDIDFCGHQTTTHYVNQDKPDGVIITEHFSDERVILEGIDNLIRPHTSSRMYRTKYNFSEVNDKAGIVYDTCIYWFYMLQNPKMVYLNRAMSTYNIHDNGMFSGASRNKRKYLSLSAINSLNNATNHMFEDIIFKRFIKTLRKIDKPLFFILFYCNKNKQHAYDYMLRKYQHSA